MTAIRAIARYVTRYCGECNDTLVQDLSQKALVKNRYQFLTSCGLQQVWSVLAMLAISTWLWGDKYGPEDVIKLRNAVKRHLKQKHRFLVMTERERQWEPPEGIERHAIKDPELLAHQGCFARLRMFDYGWQRNRNIDDRLVCLDLDIVITNRLDQLFDRPETFVILGGANSVNPCPYNGSVMMLRPGHHGELWTEFSMEKAQQIKYHVFPDDQGWIAHLLPNAATWPCGTKSGIYAFKKPGWPVNSFALPADARIVAFPGARRPQDYAKKLHWVRMHWA